MTVLVVAAQMLVPGVVAEVEVEVEVEVLVLGVMLVGRVLMAAV